MTSKSAPAVYWMPCNCASEELCHGACLPVMQHLSLVTRDCKHCIYWSDPHLSCVTKDCICWSACYTSSIVLQTFARDEVKSDFSMAPSSLKHRRQVHACTYRTSPHIRPESSFRQPYTSPKPPRPMIR